MAKIINFCVCVISVVNMKAYVFSFILSYQLIAAGAQGQQQMLMQAGLAQQLQQLGKVSLGFLYQFSCENLHKFLHYCKEFSELVAPFNFTFFWQKNKIFTMLILHEMYFAASGQLGPRQSVESSESPRASAAPTAAAATQLTEHTTVCFSTTGSVVC